MTTVAFKESKAIVNGNQTYPKKLFAKIEQGDTKDEWLNTSEDAEQFAEVGESVLVGVYKLDHVEVISASVSREPIIEGNGG